MTAKSDGEPIRMFSPERSAATGFAINGLDRMVFARDDEATFARLLADPRSSGLLIHQDAAIVRRAAGLPSSLFSLSETEGLSDLEEAVLLGMGESGAVFALPLRDGLLEEAVAGEPTRPRKVLGRQNLFAIGVRSLALEGALNPHEIGFIGQAKSLLGWHARHRFCSACGNRTKSAGAGWRRACESCGSHHFPRTDPVVIMLAVRGDECLLGRQPRFPKGMYSALAGFLEPGETVENAVRRELFEESGILVGRVSYHASQPWPFPSSLMIGCFAEAQSAHISMDKAELEDCRWFHRAELRKMFAAEHPDGFTAPQPIAIAHLLMLDWLEGRVGSSA